ncbi:hemerythrin HHE cation binding domain-containing protein [Fontibacillus phaseoli]|uniref:Hemerythrin HHE cation binding domain-containing protein n=1 Tax=Fontibacillus phaseoli TaxID=1416533 RepID=A0A369BS35_9BACL|nr:hemerythrin domain-containing protein [Fontibacillus phaseoli]RCX23855.1 hemerythrin HHE cation binding domain-containing protein [Fontibacillus phaseoli]
MENTKFRTPLPAMRILENEHGYLSHLMSQWHSIVLNLQNDRYTTDQAGQEFVRLRQLLAEFKAPLEQHTKKEEAFFFPLLGQYIGHDQGPLVSIENEHEEIVAYIDHFLHHSDGNFSMQEMKDMSRDAGEAFEILTVHFVKEESVLFPMTAQVLKQAEQERLYEELHTLIL